MNGIFHDIESQVELIVPRLRKAAKILTRRARFGQPPSTSGAEEKV